MQHNSNLISSWAVYNCSSKSHGTNSRHTEAANPEAKGAVSVLQPIISKGSRPWNAASSDISGNWTNTVYESPSSVVPQSLVLMNPGLLTIQDYGQVMPALRICPLSPLAGLEARMEVSAKRDTLYAFLPTVIWQKKIFPQQCPKWVKDRLCLTQGKFCLTLGYEVLNISSQFTESSSFILLAM